MPKTSTPSFILELPLRVMPEAGRVLCGRLEAARRLYNSVLHDALHRLDRMRESTEWQAANRLPKGPERTAAFKSCAKQFKHSEYDCQARAIHHKNAAKLQDCLGSHETQKIGSRVWAAVKDYQFGDRGRPRFKGQARPLHSIESKTNAAGIRWNQKVQAVLWGGLALPALVPSLTKDPYVHECLAQPTKYCRVVWRMQRGVRRWFVQLIQEGLPSAKYSFNSKGKTVGLDIGPSTIAVVADGAVALQVFAPSVEQPWAEIRKLQRAQDRSRRAMNPDNYNADGTAKTKPTSWNKSTRYLKRQAEIAELERKLAEGRKSDHGQMANRILSLGLIVKTEKLSYTSFQKNFGRSTKVRAPGMFIELLTRKAERAGGSMVQLNTRKLCMSQYDHVTQVCTKKPLKQRWHALGNTSVWVQRDCYSAFLAKNVELGQHNPTQLKKSWAAAEPLLRRAGLCIDKVASGIPSGKPSVLIPTEQLVRRKEPKRGLSQGENPGNPAPERS